MLRAFIRGMTHSYVTWRVHIWNDLYADRQGARKEVIETPWAYPEHEPWGFYLFPPSAWMIHLCDMTLLWNHTRVSCVTAWLIHVCDMRVPHARTLRIPSLPARWVVCEWFICVTWLFRTCGACHSVTHSYVWHEGTSSTNPEDSISSRQVSCVWMIHVCDMTRSYVWRVSQRDSFICVTWVYSKHEPWGLHLCPPSAWMIHVCDLTPSCVLHDLLMGVAWSIHMCDMTPSYVWHDSFICVACLMDVRGVTHPYVWHQCTMSMRPEDSISSRQVSKWLICVTRLLHMRCVRYSVTHSYVWPLNELRHERTLSTCPTNSISSRQARDRTRW